MDYILVGEQVIIIFLRILPVLSTTMIVSAIKVHWVDLNRMFCYDWVFSSRFQKYHQLPSNFLYKPHLSKQHNFWSRRCICSIPYRRYSNYIFILDLTRGFNVAIYRWAISREEPMNFFRNVCSKITFFYFLLNPHKRHSLSEIWGVICAFKLRSKASVTAVMYPITCHIGASYNGVWLCADDWTTYQH